MAVELLEGDASVVRFLDRLAEQVVDDFVVGTLASLSAELAAVAPLVLVLYLVLWGYRMFEGVAPPRALVGELVRLSAVLALILHYETYNRLVKEPVYRFPEDLAAVLVGSETGVGVIELIDRVLTEGFRVGAAYWAEGGMFGAGIGLTMIAILIWISVVLPVALAAFLIVLSKLYLGVLLAVGPLVILLTLFDRTRGIFDRWVAELLTKGLTVVFAILVPRILLHHFLAQLQTMIEIDDHLQTSLATLVVVLFFAIAQVLFYWQVPGLAAALGAGLQLAPHGIDRRVHERVLALPSTLGIGAALEALDDYWMRVQLDREAGAPGAAPSRWGGRCRRPW